ncbi:MAG: tyrosine--tRNA ligase [Victivallaceae bacterium]|nr:tyrosine--tRNA ligase [Victivallaceae bacterium]
MKIYEELKRRGFIYQETDSAAIESRLNQGGVTFYCGFDPTGSSLHVGHLLPIMAMRLLQRSGNIPTVLVGGATGAIGDPSGRSSARNMLTMEEVASNVEHLRAQLGRFITLAEGRAHFVNNFDWLGKLTLIDFLRDIGSKFSVNRMMTQESVKSRMENGLSYLEFSYSLLQAYDFYHLNRELGCELEIGGQDQWGNMVAGTELIRRMSNEEKQVYCLTIPLLINPATGQKFGKSIGGTSVWLDPERTSVFDYYQFWRNCDDAMVGDLLKKFAIDLPVEECENLAVCGNINRAKEILAYEATSMAHGAQAAAEAYLSAGTQFGFADPEKKISTSSAVFGLSCERADNYPEAEFESAPLDGEGWWIVKLLTGSGLCGSGGDARRMIQGNAVKLNGEKVTDVNFKLVRGMLKDGTALLQSGKKNFRKLVFK